MQVKEHAALALDELQSALVQRPPQLRMPPADFGAHLSRAQRHEALAEHTRRHSAACVRAHKLLAETCMETRPPDVQGALAAFSRALPDLPRLGEPSGGGALPAQVAAELLRDAPFATLLASCYGHVASGVLAQAESLQADNAALRDDVAANLAETVENEGRIDPEAVTTADEVEAAKRAAVVQAAPPARARPVQLTPRELADAMLAVQAMRLPQLAEAEAPRASLRIAETRRLGGRMPSRRQSLAVTANTMKLEEAAMPKRGSLAWLLLPPHQKLEQLCMWLAAARAQRASALVVMATPSCAQYAVSLLEALQEEELFHFPRMSAVLCGRSPGARTQVRRCSVSNTSLALRSSAAGLPNAHAAAGCGKASRMHAGGTRAARARPQRQGRGLLRLCGGAERGRVEMGPRSHFRRPPAMRRRQAACALLQSACHPASAAE